jgi:hypothetical protein
LPFAFEGKTFSLFDVELSLTRLEDSDCSEAMDESEDVRLIGICGTAVPIDDADRSGTSGSRAGVEGWMDEDFPKPDDLKDGSGFLTEHSMWFGSTTT